MKVIKPWIVRKSCTKTKMQKQLGEHFCVCLIVVRYTYASLIVCLIVVVWSCHLKEVSRSLSLSHQLSVFFSNSGSELWFFVLLSSLSSVTMRNSVCSRDGGGADIENDTGKEGKSSQLLSIREKKNESDWVQRENPLERVGWPGGCKGIKNPSKPDKKTSESFSWETHKKSSGLWL